MIYLLAHKISADPLQVGLKAACLSRVQSIAKLPVPETFVVPAAVQAMFQASCAEFPERRKGMDLSSSRALRLTSWKLRSALAAQKFPAEAWPFLDEHLIRFKQKGIDLVAVRTSPVVEESLPCSGTYASHLCVPLREVKEYIRECWLSVWSDKAISWRLQHKEPLDARVGVIVQAMVDPLSTVELTTVDAARGDLSGMWLAARLGLQEAGVPAAPDQWIIEKSGYGIRDERIAAKTQKLVPLSLGGMHEVPLSQKEIETAALDADTIKELARLGNRAEKLLGTPLKLSAAVTSESILVTRAEPLVDIAPRWQSVLDLNLVFSQEISEPMSRLIRKATAVTSQEYFEMIRPSKRASNLIKATGLEISLNANAIHSLRDEMAHRMQHCRGVSRAALLTAAFPWLRGYPIEKMYEIGLSLAVPGEASPPGREGPAGRNPAQEAMVLAERAALLLKPVLTANLVQRALAEIIHEELLHHIPEGLVSELLKPYTLHETLMAKDIARNHEPLGFAGHRVGARELGGKDRILAEVPTGVRDSLGQLLDMAADYTTFTRYLNRGSEALVRQIVPLLEQSFQSPEGRTTLAAFY